MVVNLTDIFLTDNKTEESSFDIDFDSVEISGVEYQLLDRKPVVLRLKNEGKGYASVSMKTSFSLPLNCDRCLKEVRYPMELTIQERVCAPDVTDFSDEERSYMDGYNLLVDDLLISNIALNWPMKILCREDCKGICKICGKDLNTGDCGCDTFVPNPGLAGIKEIFNANKEV